jgi:multimeric flavodoxin WrbA
VKALAINASPTYGQEGNTEAALSPFLDGMKADIQVFATPLYVDGMPGSLKNLLGRTTLSGYPHVELPDGHCCMPRRESSGTGKSEQETA